MENLCGEKGNIEIMVQIATDVKQHHFRGLWYSDFGEGKTYLLGLFHNALKERGTKGLYLLDTDRGVNTLATGGFDVAFDDVSGGTKSQSEDAYQFFTRRLNELDQNEGEGYGAVAIDSLTTLQKIIMAHVHTISTAKRPLGGILSSQQDYGALIQIMENLFPFLQRLSTHMDVIMTAHLLERRNEDTGQLWLLPSIMGKKFPSQIGLWFNEVWRLSAERSGNEITRKAQTASFNRHKCKSQVADMPHILPVEEALERTMNAYSKGQKIAIPTSEERRSAAK